MNTTYRNSGTLSEELNLRIHGMEEGAEGIGKLFNETIAENFPNLCNSTDNRVQEAFKFQIDMNRKEQSYITS
jgi:hypothetical protein